VARDLGWVDSVELTLAGATLGIPHPTGYPLYLLWARLAFLAGGIAGVNFLAALCAAAAVAITYLLARALGFGRAGGIVAAAALAMHPELIRQATVAEVYTFHLTLVVLLLWLAVAIGRSPSPRSAGDGFAYGLGLGLAHHLTILFALPAAIAFGWPAFRSRGGGPGGRGGGADRRLLLRRLCLLGLPLTLYAVLLVRSRFDPALDLGDPSTPARLLAHASGRQFSYRMVSDEPGYLAGELSAWGRRTAAEWPIPLLLLAAIGVAALGLNRDRRRFAIGLLLLGGVTGLHAAAYRIPDKDPYFLPATLALALLAGAGTGAVASGVRSLARARAGARAGASAGGRSALGPAVDGVLLGSIGWALVAHSSAVDRHADHSLRDLVHEVFRRAPAGSLIIADDTSLAFALRFLAQEPGGPGERTVVASYFLPLEWYAASLADLDPELPSKVERLAQARRGLSGRALGDRLAANARGLAADLARQAGAAGRPVRFTFHDFDREHPVFEGLALQDLGLVYALPPGGGEGRAGGQANQLSRPEPEFACLAAYTAQRPMTREERSLAKRLSAAANRAGIADVKAAELARAEVEFGRAIALDSLYAQAWLNRGLLRADYLQAPAGALADWRRYLTLVPPGPEAEAVRARVAALAAGEVSREVSRAALDSARSRP
jgi:tetratricopeptide (TPR) repeat protein